MFRYTVSPVAFNYFWKYKCAGIFGVGVFIQMSIELGNNFVSISECWKGDDSKASQVGWVDWKNFVLVGCRSVLMRINNMWRIFFFYELKILYFRLLFSFVRFFYGFILPKVALVVELSKLLSK